MKRGVLTTETDEETSPADIQQEMETVTLLNPLIVSSDRTRMRMSVCTRRGSSPGDLVYKLHIALLR